jgi:hypothetical protein
LEDQVTINNARLLFELIDWWKPELYDLRIDWLSPQTAEIWILDSNYSYSRWMACLGLDQRWTLSPRD